MEGVQINLVCCTQVLLQNLGAKECRQKDIALVYAMAIKSEHQKADVPDWKTINEAILKRWSMSGLDRIKKRAWDILAGKVQP